MRYKEESDERLGQQAAASWRYRCEPADDPDRVILSGSCPKCRHSFDYDWPLVVVRQDAVTPGRVDQGDGAAEPGSAAWEGAGETERIPVICRCRVTHPGSNGEKGCGRSWTLTVQI